MSSSTASSVPFSSTLNSASLKRPPMPEMDASEDSDSERDGISRLSTLLSPLEFYREFDLTVLHDRLTNREYRYQDPKTIEEHILRQLETLNHSNSIPLKKSTLSSLLPWLFKCPLELEQQFLFHSDIEFPFSETIYPRGFYRSQWKARQYLLLKMADIAYKAQYYEFLLSIQPLIVSVPPAAQRDQRTWKFYSPAEYLNSISIANLFNPNNPNGYALFTPSPVSESPLPASPAAASTPAPATAPSAPLFEYPAFFCLDWSPESELLEVQRQIDFLKLFFSSVRHLCERPPTAPANSERFSLGCQTFPDELHFYGRDMEKEREREKAEREKEKEKAQDKLKGKTTKKTVENKGKDKDKGKEKEKEIKDNAAPLESKEEKTFESDVSALSSPVSSPFDSSASTPASASASAPHYSPSQLSQALELHYLHCLHHALHYSIHLKNALYFYDFLVDFYESYQALFHRAMIPLDSLQFTPVNKEKEKEKETSFPTVSMPFHRDLVNFMTFAVKALYCGLMSARSAAAAAADEKDSKAGNKTKDAAKSEKTVSAKGGKSGSAAGSDDGNAIYSSVWSSASPLFTQCFDWFPLLTRLAVPLAASFTRDQEYELSNAALLPLLQYHSQHYQRLYSSVAQNQKELSQPNPFLIPHYEKYTIAAIIFWNCSQLNKEIPASLREASGPAAAASPAAIDRLFGVYFSLLNYQYAGLATAPIASKDSKDNSSAVSSGNYGKLAELCVKSIRDYHQWIESLLKLHEPAASALASGGDSLSGRGSPSSARSRQRKSNSAQKSARGDGKPAAVESPPLNPALVRSLELETSAVSLELWSRFCYLALESQETLFVLIGCKEVLPLEPHAFAPLPTMARSGPTGQSELNIALIEPGELEPVKALDLSLGSLDSLQFGGPPSRHRFALSELSLKASIWLSLVEFSMSRALHQSLNPRKHDKNALDSLLLRCLDHQQRAMAFIAHGIEWELRHFPRSTKSQHDIQLAQQLIVAQAKHFYNACLPLTTEPIRRLVLLPYVSAVVNHIDSAMDSCSGVFRAPEQANAAANPGPHPLVAAAAAQGRLLVQFFDPSFRAVLYSLLLDCSLEAGDYPVSHALSQCALLRLPSNEKRLIQPYKVLCMAKLGLEINASMFSGGAKAASKQSVESLAERRFTRELDQANFYSQLARQCQSPVDAFQFLQKSISVIQSVPEQRIPYILDFATWLYQREFTFPYIEDQLITAANLLLAKEGERIAAIATQSSEEKESKDPSLSASPSSASLSTSVSGFASPSLSARSLTSARSAQSISGNSTIAALKKRLEAEAAAAKKASERLNRSPSAGSTRSTESDAAHSGSERLSCRQLAQLAQIYIALARYAKQANCAVQPLPLSKERPDSVPFHGFSPVPASVRLHYASLAHFHICRMIQTTVFTLWELRSADSTASTASVDFPSYLPGSAEEFLSFDFSPSVLQYIRDLQAEKRDVQDPATVSPRSKYLKYMVHSDLIPMADLQPFLIDLNFLSDLFYEFDLLSHSAVVLQFAALMSSECLHSENEQNIRSASLGHTIACTPTRTIHSALELQLARIYYRLGANNIAEKHFQSAQPVTPNAAELAAFQLMLEERERLKEMARKARKAQQGGRGDSKLDRRASIDSLASLSTASVADGDSRVTTPGSARGFRVELMRAKSTAAASNSSRTPGTAAGHDAPQDPEPAEADSLQASETSVPVASYSTSYLLRVLWFSQVRVLLDLGHFATAKTLLQLVYRHLLAYEDVYHLRDYYYLSCLIAEREGNPAAALSLLQATQRYHGNSVHQWAQILPTFIRLLSRTQRQPQRRRQKRLERQLALVKAARKAFDFEDSKAKPSEAKWLIAKLHELSAEIYLEEADSIMNEQITFLSEAESSSLSASLVAEFSQGGGARGSKRAVAMHLAAAELRAASQILKALADPVHSARIALKLHAILAHQIHRLSSRSPAASSAVLPLFQEAFQVLFDASSELRDFLRQSPPGLDASLRHPLLMLHCELELSIAELQLDFDRWRAPERKPFSEKDKEISPFEVTAGGAHYLPESAVDSLNDFFFSKYSSYFTDAAEESVVPDAPALPGIIRHLPGNAGTLQRLGTIDASLAILTTLSGRSAVWDEEFRTRFDLARGRAIAMKEEENQKRIDDKLKKKWQIMTQNGETAEPAPVAEQQEEKEEAKVPEPAVVASPPPKSAGAASPRNVKSPKTNLVKKPGSASAVPEPEVKAPEIGLQFTDRSSFLARHQPSTAFQRLLSSFHLNTSAHDRWHPILMISEHEKMKEKLRAWQQPADPGTPVAADKDKAKAKPAASQKRASSAKGKPAPSFTSSAINAQILAASDDHPSLPALMSSSLETLQSALDRAMQNAAFDAASSAALQLANLIGLLSPAAAIRYLNLALSARVSSLGHRAFLALANRSIENESTPGDAALTQGGVSVEALALERQASNRAALALEPREAKLTKAFLNEYSLVAQRTSLVVEENSKDGEAPEPAQPTPMSHYAREYSELLSSAPSASALFLTFLFDSSSHSIFVSCQSPVMLDCSIARHQLSADREREFLSLIGEFRVFEKELRSQVMKLNSSVDPAMDDLESTFNELSDWMADFLSPILFDALLTSAEQLRNREVILLLDQSFFGLPVESLKLFQFAHSVTRDYSLHMFYQRSKRSASSIVSRAAIQYVVDSHDEDKTLFESPRSLTARIFEEIVNSMNAAPAKINSPNATKAKAPAPAWSGMVGKDRQPSFNDWQRLIAPAAAQPIADSKETKDHPVPTAAGFLYFGFESLFSRLSPSALLNHSLAQHGLILLCSGAVNEMSARHYSRLQSQRSPEEREADSPYLSGLLLSIRGAQAIFSRRHAIAPVANAALTKVLFDSLGLGSGEFAPPPTDAGRASRLLSTAPTDPNAVFTAFDPRPVAPSRGQRSSSVIVQGSRSLSAASQLSPRGSIVGRGKPGTEQPTKLPWAIIVPPNKYRIRSFDLWNHYLIGLPAVKIQ